MLTEIIIFEDNEQLRSSLVVLLNGSDLYTVTGDYENVNDASDIVRRDRPDVVIMDIDLPGKSGIQGVAEIKEARPATLVTRSSGADPIVPAVRAQSETRRSIAYVPASAATVPISSQRHPGAP